MKKCLAFIFTLIVALTATISVYASNVSVFTNNTADTKVSLGISSGTATANVKCNALKSNFKSAKIDTKIQKKVGIIWVTVDNGSWTETTKSTKFAKAYSVKLSSKGTYRAHVKFTVSGTGGSDDEITKNVEKTY